MGTATELISVGLSGSQAVGLSSPVSGLSEMGVVQL